MKQRLLQLWDEIFGFVRPLVPIFGYMIALLLFMKLFGLLAKL